MSLRVRGQGSGSGSFIDVFFFFSRPKTHNKTHNGSKAITSQIRFGSLADPVESPNPNFQNLQYVQEMMFESEQHIKPNVGIKRGFTGEVEKVKNLFLMTWPVK